jgi:hypothetical protein
MASQYENLPVYKAALDLVTHFENTVRNFDRYNKYMVGNRLRDLSYEVLLLVARANRKMDRNKCLNEALVNLQDLRIVVHVCKEIKAFKSFKSFEFVVKAVEGISRQCEGWLRSQNSQSRRL